ncbi:MAG: arylesterase [Porticoccaceae bacterium]|jgi:acyl-CoA thioesterase-1|nr:arylesterase [Porticoccaceae bacterium]|tara:strand:+ start:610 stop:1212 length:603 start_codon:yes stop_codon:yes gene_type:complete
MRTIFKRLCCLFILLGANTYGSTLLVLGDSLSAGYGIDPANGWVNLLQEDLSANYKVVNGSISGDTTGGGLARLPLLLEKFQPDFVILELGGNDGLRGQPLKLMKKNLAAMIALCTDANAVPVLFGMRIPPNYGRRYTTAFADVYNQLADETNTLLIPFQLDELAVTEGMIQQDGLHPTEKAQPAIKAVVARVMQPLLQP